jgi:hypothetical protein
MVVQKKKLEINDLFEEDFCMLVCSFHFSSGRLVDMALRLCETPLAGY